MEEEQVTQAERLRQFLASPVWTDVLKPMLYNDFQIKVRQLVESNDPDKDRVLKAELRAWGAVLDFETSALRKLKEVEAELEEQKKRALAAMDTPVGSPYGR